MKKLLCSILLALCLCFCISGCGRSIANTTESDRSEETETRLITSVSDALLYTDKTSSKSSGLSVSTTRNADETKDTISEERSAVLETKPMTPVQTTSALVTKQPTSTQSRKAEDDWAAAYQKFIQSGSYHNNNHDYEAFALRDFDRDGIPELIFTYYQGTYYHTFIYSYKNGTVEESSAPSFSHFSQDLYYSDAFPGLFSETWKRETGYANEMPMHIEYWMPESGALNNTTVAANYDDYKIYTQITDNDALYRAAMEAMESNRILKLFEPDKIQAGGWKAFSTAYGY